MDPPPFMVPRNSSNSAQGREADSASGWNDAAAAGTEVNFKSIPTAVSNSFSSSTPIPPRANFTIPLRLIKSPPYKLNYAHSTTTLNCKCKIPCCLAVSSNTQW